MCNAKARAKVFKQPHESFGHLEIEIPEPDNEEIIVQITYTTICTSDLHTYYGRRKSPSPGILGHEIIGKIVKLGQHIHSDYNGEKITTGDLITWSVYAFDPDNLQAKRGIPQKSPGLFKYGHQTILNDSPLSGGFATHCVLKKGSSVFKLSTELLPSEAAPLNCTHATVAGALRLAGDIDNKNVMVFGAGMLGLSACAMSKERGAKNVYAADINPERLSTAKKFGTSETFIASLSKTEIIENLNGEDIDIVIDTTGNPEAMALGINLLTLGGVAVWVGAVYNAPKTQIDAETIVRNILSVKGLHNYTPQDLATAIEFMNSCHKKYPFKELVGKEYSLCELDTAFKTANTGVHHRVGINQNL